MRKTTINHHFICRLGILLLFSILLGGCADDGNGDADGDGIPDGIAVIEKSDGSNNVIVIVPDTGSDGDVVVKDGTDFGSVTFSGKGANELNNLIFTPVNVFSGTFDNGDIWVSWANENEVSLDIEVDPTIPTKVQSIDVDTNDNYWGVESNTASDGIPRTLIINENTVKMSNVVLRSDTSAALILNGTLYY